MKKVFLTAVLAMSALAVSAGEIGLSAGHTYGNESGDSFGVTLGTNVGAYGVTGGVEQSKLQCTEQTRYSVVGSREIFKLSSASVSAKAGVAYLDNKVGADGWAGTVGLGVDIPVSKDVTVAVDYKYQSDLQTVVQRFNGNSVTAGLKFRF